jgi:hypothetical protein
MRLRKIVTGLLIASTLGLSVPAIAADAEGKEFVNLGDGNWIVYAVSITALGLSIVAVVDAGKSP